MDIIAVQDRYAPNGICFGCGSLNSKGLRIKSHWEGDDFVMKFTPSEEHQAFSGTINGGILGTLLDCHSNWCAATSLYYKYPDQGFPSTVTTEFNVTLKRPTPFGEELTIIANSTKIEGNKVTVDARVLVTDKITAICNSIFIAVKDGHPAYHRWK